MDRPAQQIRFCKSRDGTRIAYAVCGEGPPLVRAGHSFSHLEYEWDCLAWRPWLELLSRRHTLIRYDARGTGLSDRDGVDFSFERLVEDMDAVIAATGIKRFDLVGITGGGALAVTHAARHPGMVERLVLYGTFARGRLARSTTPAKLAETELILKMMELDWGQDHPEFRQLFTYQYIPDGTAEQLRSFNELMRVSTSAANAAQYFRASFKADVRDLAPKVSCPALVLHARGDLRMPFEEGRELATLIPGAHFISLDSRNHFLSEQEPAWQQLTAELERFLQQPAPAVAIGDFEGLTTRERAVLDVLVQGLVTDAMAERLGMTEKTVRNHLSTIYSKLGVENRSQAIVLAQDKGFGRKLAADRK
jgi:pimeloyl-ACP methyl ester carboxylesterase/DNA-binding CsgD family transcriptional regulator